MKKVILLCYLILNATLLFSQGEKVNIIVFGAHPDDCDIDTGGTAILLAKMGHNVKFVSLTNGDAGHYAMGGGELAKVRIAEAEEAGKRFGVTYTVLDNHDGELMPTLENRLKVIREIRKWKADVVIAPRPNDYHPDHRYTGVLVQDAAYMVIVPNVAPEVPPLQKNPVFLYSEDSFQKPSPFEPDIAVIIDSVFDQKVYAMSAHKSQFFEWLPWTSGNLEKVPKDDQGRLEMLANWRSQPPKEALLKCAAKWYGTKASSANHIEGFEICEYGKQPTDDEIRTLFPMLKK
ncbi:PIG-L deacetylase family protein [Arenibacter sp. ARW7G5Y1]|uniref:PIG-L deacetylase family protein n=1 Tax=Arenibacter sp. ARW7G5Y1 TaxID=2135619 RepID=UPI000D76F4F6|nr:PIG-L family deacetylase [Arenibacter sp. ARW7G5Y1]PXX25976.1 LmbE family N-acetylglucosaminyl deacetylase [Arenibacter sp. ARW7G5Y1]|tara:strand:+ start:33082 stop:33951 length:870 start_codon:yes stop_codon:yes gene_type:complete